jgi:uncharacterized cupin superfamily protein
MNVTRFAQAPAYQAQDHMDVQMVRLQGREAGPADVMWLGVSHIMPGGGTTLDTSAQEKMYVVLDGEVTVSNGTEEVALRRWDSCRIAGGEGRQLSNRTDQPATILLAMPLA